MNRVGKYTYIVAAVIGVITAGFLGISFAQNNTTSGTRNPIRLSRTQNLSAQ